MRTAPYPRYPLSVTSSRGRSSSATTAPPPSCIGGNVLMRRLKLVLGVAALMVAIMAASAAPAAAQTFFTTGDDDEECFFFDDEECFFLDDEEECFFFDDEDCFFIDGNDGFFDVGEGIAQETGQEAESGDIDQSFDVSSTGDNSNQTVSTQGVANTGNAQNVIDVVQVGGDADDFEFDEVGSSITVSPSSTTNSVQRIGQSASAD